MDQEKIGKFILKLRKEKNMTQQDLAEKIGVTDRAVSKWENGRGMPDLSLMKSLCNELGITVNDLISGERIDKKDYPKKSDENIINTIDYKEKEIKKNKKVFKIVLGVIFLMIVLFITMFLFDVRMMNLNKPVIFSTWGYDYTPAINFYENDIYFAIKDYLVDKGDREEKHYDDEKTFVSMRIYLTEEIRKDKLYYIYAWVVDSKYYVVNNELKESSGSSIPYMFKVEKINDEYEVIDYQFPRDGSYYAEDMNNIFPRSVKNDMDRVHTDGTIDRLLMEVLEDAKLYFHK